MSTALPALTRSDQGRRALFGVVLVAVSLSVAFVVGDPGGSLIPLLVVAAAGLMGAVWLGHTYAGFLMMVFSSYFMPVIAADPDQNRYLSAFDLILPFMVPVAFFGSLRQNAQARDAAEVGDAHDKIRTATSRFGKVVILYYALCVVSIIPLAVRAGGVAAMNSSFLLARSFQAVLMFPLALWWLRSERRISMVFVTAGAAACMLAVVSLYQRIVVGTWRPGMTWVVSDLSLPTEDPNQAGVAMVAVLALLFARHAIRSTPWTYFVTINAIVVIVLTLSRSSLVALSTFVLLSLRRARLRYILVGLALIGLAAVAVPENFRERLLRTFTLERGSADVYSFMIRVYGYLACLGVLKDNWLFGTGYHGGGYFTHLYNPLGILGLSGENYFLETAMGLGIFGFGVLVACIVRLYQLGKAVREAAPPGTLGHQMAVLHVPLITGILAANMTGNNLNGAAAGAEVAIWCALMVRAGHDAVSRAQNQLS